MRDPTVCLPPSPTLSVKYQGSEAWNDLFNGRKYKMNVLTRFKKGTTLLWLPKLISILLSGKQGDADVNEPVQKKAKKAGVAVAMQVIVGSQS